MSWSKFTRFGRDRRGVSAIVFGVAGVMLAMCVGLVIDVASYMYLRTDMGLAADAGVLTSVTVAATQLGPNPTTYTSLGQQAGLSRFMAHSGRVTNATAKPGVVTTPTSSVTVTRNGSVITGSLSWSTTYTPFFAGLFGVSAWTMTGVSGSSVNVNTPYVNVYIVIDDSPSMQIGATNSDISTLQQLVPCSNSGAYFMTGPSSWTQIAPASGQPYSNYACTWQGATYDGGLTCPTPVSSPYTYTVMTPNTSGGAASGPSCQGWLSPYAGQYPHAGPPCGFACHFDTSKPAGSGSDFYGIARGTIGKSNQVTLRLDIVKSAVKDLMAAMRDDSGSSSYFNTAIYTLDSVLTQIYPVSGDAGDAWTTAVGYIGSPPSTANGADTGIQPYVSNFNTAATDFADNLAALAQKLTAAGGGTTAATPQKILILITDGFEDYKDSSGTRVMGALSPSYCEPFKAMGYQVFVLYMPYTPLMDSFYLQYVMPAAEGTGVGSISYNLQQCASSPSDYAVATNLSEIEATLRGFVNISMASAAHLSH